MTEESALWRSLSELTIADQLCTLAHREPLAGFAVWAEEMARNLSARDRASEVPCLNCDNPADPGSERCAACDYIAYQEREDERGLEAP